ncbi:MAG: outer membrane protein [Blastocatellia bacterium]|jgi:HAE1 family hydrophobic/amphiphilic exporter-1|nr:outer membrane protein [Blastocatellia bacterium]
MSNQLPRAFNSALVLALFLLTCFGGVMAQTPSPTPVNPATLPPGQEQQPPATAPPGVNIIPGAQPTPNNTVIQEPRLSQEPRQPNFPDVQVQPLPPLPDLSRVGIVSSNMVPLSLNDAIRRALQNNNDIEVSRDDVRFAEQQLRGLYGVYDPIFSVTPQIIQNITPQQSSLGGSGSTGKTTSTTFNLNPSVTKTFEKTGGTYTLSFANSHVNTTNSFSLINPYYSSNLALNINQPLLRNRSIDSSRHAIRVQKKRLEQTDSDFRQRTILVISQVQAAYWNLVFALRNQQNQLDSLNLARQNMRNIEIQIGAGAKAPLDRAQVQTDIATREANLFIATQTVSQAENTLKQLMLRDPMSPEWSAQLTPTDTPSLEILPVNLATALDEAHKNRPELRRLALQKDINKVDLQFYKNQTLPQVDIQSTFAATGLAGTSLGLPAGSLVPLISGNPNTSSSAFLLQQIQNIQRAQNLPVAAVPNAATSGAPANLIGGYGQDLTNLFGLGTRNITVGVAISLPLHNRTAKANLAGARIQTEQLEASYRSQDQAVEMDVRNAAQAVDTAQKRMIASTRARESADQQLAGEQKLYEVGRSTTFLLLQRQNELTIARTAELQAQTDYNKALADLQRATAATLRVNNVVVSDPTKP